MNALKAWAAKFATAVDGGRKLRELLPIRGKHKRNAEIRHLVQSVAGTQEMPCTVRPALRF